MTVTTSDEPEREFPVEEKSDEKCSHAEQADTEAETTTTKAKSNGESPALPEINEISDAERKTHDLNGTQTGGGNEVSQAERNASGNKNGHVERSVSGNEISHMERTVSGNEVSHVERSMSVKSSASPPKETAFDWLVLFCAFGSNVIFGMDFNSFSVFYPILMEYFEASAAQIGWCLSISAFVAAIFSIFSSYPIEVYGCRRPAVIGSVVYCIGVAATSLVPNLGVFYLTFGIVAGFGASICGLTSSVIVQQRFHRNRGLVSGISVLGFSCGGIIGPPIANVLIENFGWRGAFLVLSAIYAHRIPFAILFITPNRYIVKKDLLRSDSNRSHHDSRRALFRYLRRAFDFSILWKQRIFSVWTCVCCLQLILMTGYIQHCVNRAVHQGVSRQQAFWASSTVGMANTSSRIVISFVGNLKCVNRCLLYACGMFLSVVSVTVLLAWPGLPGTMASAVFFGLMAGCTGTIHTVVTVDLVGVAILTRCLAIQQFVFGFFRLTTSPFVGWIFDITHDYNVPFAFLGCCGGAAGILMIVVYILQKRQRAALASASSSSDHHRSHRPPHHHHSDLQKKKKKNKHQDEQKQELPAEVVSASAQELSNF